MYKQSGNIKKEIENLKRNLEFPEVKSIITEIKFTRRIQSIFEKEKNQWTEIESEEQRKNIEEKWTKNKETVGHHNAE